MNNLKSRLLKLEQANNPSEFAIIAVNDGETNETAYQRCFATNRFKPQVIIYATPPDMRL